MQSINANNVNRQLQSGHVLASPIEIGARWYALYTCANFEKQVAAALESRSIERFLPLYSSVRRWKDRRVTLDLPLFPGYVFVRATPNDRDRALQIRGAVRFVSSCGVPSVLSDEAIEILRSGLSGSLRAEPHPYLTMGRRVRITSGPLAGIEGILRRKRNASRVVVSLNLIQRSVAVDVDIVDVTPIF